MTGTGSDLLRNVQAANREREQRQREKAMADDRPPVDTPSPNKAPPPTRKNHV